MYFGICFDLIAISVDTENVCLNIDVRFNGDEAISVVDVLMEIKIFLL